MSESPKIFAYHNSNNGVSFYRVWQPMKWLKRLGWNVKRLPDKMAGLVMPLEGKGGNVPGAESHEAVTKWADILFSNFRRSYGDMTRLAAQAHFRPLVIDIDDDVDTLDQSNFSYKDWQGDPNGDMVSEIPEGTTEEELAKRKKEGWVIGEKDGKRFMCMPTGMSGAEIVHEQLRMAHLVTVSTPYLAERYRKYNANVAVVPNAIDFETWKKVEPKDDGIVRIGLFGSNSHHKDWRECIDAISRILDEYPNVRLLFNGWLVMEEAKEGASIYELKRHFKFPDYLVERGLHEHERVEIYEPVEIQDYAGWLMDKKIDIGLAPLAWTAFNRSKSNLKYLEFGAMGVPGVYADMEPYADVVHGVTGLKASKPIDYYTQIKKLVESKELRESIGNAAHEDVRARYDASKVAEVLAAKLDETMKNYQGAKQWLR